MREEKNYKVLEMGEGTTTFGAGNISPCLPKKQAQAYRDSLVEEGLRAVVFPVDKDGRAIA